MRCKCGHPIEVHGDRALFPACEGNHSNPGPLMIEDGPEYRFIRHAPRSMAAACECKGFTSSD